MQTKVAFGQRSGERVCVLWWTEFTTYDVSTSPRALTFQIRARKEIVLVVVQRFVYGAVKRKDNLCVKNKIKDKLQSLTGGGPRTLLCQINGRKIKVFVDDGPYFYMWCCYTPEWHLSIRVLISLMSAHKRTLMD